MSPRPRLKPLARVLSPVLPRRTPPLSIAPAIFSHHARRLRICHSIPTGSNSKPSTRAYSSSSASEPLPAPSSRWYSDLKARLGKCIMFGCSREQARRAASVLQALATEWRTLTAGVEGFLTGGRRGLEGQQVVWGEMDSFVGPARP